MRIRLFALLFTMLLILLTFGCVRAQKPKIIESKQDKQALAQSSLEWAILEQKIPDYQFIKDKNNIIISTENIGKDYRFSLGDIKISILTPEEIRQKAEDEGDFLYLRFMKFNIKKSSARVILENRWTVGHPYKAYLSGGGAEIRFIKKDNNWVRDDKTIRTWII